MPYDSRFLPTTKEDLAALSRDVPDFVYVTGDAYVDHPSFGPAIISRVLTALGYTVAMLPQPDFRSTTDFQRFGRPRLGFLVSAGNIDSMVAHYTVAKKRRGEDFYSPGKRAGLRPDRATIVYCNRIREAFGDIPLIIGGLEASLRRFAHYDYWEDRVRRSILVDARADLLSYGMGERSIARIAELLDRGVPIKKIRDVRGTVFLGKRGDAVHFPVEGGLSEDGSPAGYDYDTLKTDKVAYARAFKRQYENNDAISGRAIVEYYGERMLVQNPPAPPLTQSELDGVYALPYARTYHPMYEAMGGVPAIEEVKFSITHNRGCFGGCNFCALAFHQGRAVRARSIESGVAEAQAIVAMPDFKGYIHDVGGPTANFRHAACEKQRTDGVCKSKRCLAPTPCKNLLADHREYIQLLSAIEAVPGVKKVFIRSGIRFDYLLADPDDSFFHKLVRDHVSGQLKVAPEHCADGVLFHMGKPRIRMYDEFREKFYRITEEGGKKQFLVPYLMSSHPGSTLDDAIELALYTKRIGLAPEQVQDFYPTPGTASTVMYYTGLDPFSGKPVYTPTSYEEKRLQRALLQWRRPENRTLIQKGLLAAGRADALLELLGPGALKKGDGTKTGSKTKAGRKTPPKASGNANTKAGGKRPSAKPKKETKKGGGMGRPPQKRR